MKLRFFYTGDIENDFISIQNVRATWPLYLICVTQLMNKMKVNEKLYICNS